MKLTVVLLLALVGLALAGRRDRGGAYGNDGHGKNRDESSSSSESEEEEKKCALFCTSDAKFKLFLDRSPSEFSCNSDVAKCGTCCDAWALSRGVSKDNIMGQENDGKCVCCERKCR